MYFSDDTVHQVSKIVLGDIEKMYIMTDYFISQ